jgi:hypothetical protein
MKHIKAGGISENINVGGVHIYDLNIFITISTFFFILFLSLNSKTEEWNMRLKFFFLQQPIKSHLLLYTYSQLNSLTGVLLYMFKKK